MSKRGGIHYKIRESEEKEIYKLFQQDKPLKEIALTVNRSYDAIVKATKPYRKVNKHKTGKEAVMTGKYFNVDEKENWIA